MTTEPLTVQGRRTVSIDPRREFRYRPAMPAVIVTRNEAPMVEVRSAAPDDAPAIAKLIGLWSAGGLTVARDEDDVLLSIHEFVVAEHAGRIIGAAALVVFSPSLAEVRSVCADPAAKGLGGASAAVEFVMDQAVSNEIDRVVLLTKIPGYFERFGFREIEADDLPSDFVAEFIIARRRTLFGRSVMARSIIG